MTPREAEHVRTLVASLDRVCIVRWAARVALAWLAWASQFPQESYPTPWEIADHEPGDVVVGLDVMPAILDPAGRIVR